MRLYNTLTRQEEEFEGPSLAFVGERHGGPQPNRNPGREKHRY